MSTPRTPWARVGGLAVALSAVIVVIVLAFSWPSVTASVQNLPIAIVGPDAQAAQLATAIEQASPGAIDLVSVSSRDDAVTQIEQRAVYGAIVLAPEPEVLEASAASPVTSQLLSGIAAQLQAKLQAAAAAQAQAAGVAAPSVTVKVTDVVPLAPSDPRGTGMIAAAFPLVFGGMIGGIGLSIVIVGVWRRLAALLIYVIVAGAAVVGVLQGWFGVLQGDFVLNWAAFSLALLAIGATIVGFAALVGRAGVAIGPVLFLLIANPISSATQPLEFLPAPWGAIGQWLPPGAGATLIRDLSYFPQADTAFPWLVLAAWAAGGLVLALLGHFRQNAGAPEAVIEDAEVAAA